MAEEKDEGKGTSEEPNKEEMEQMDTFLKGKEDDPKDPSKKTPKGEEEEKKEEEKKSLPDEPQTRFQKKEQSPEDKRMGFKFRKLEKENKKLKKDAGEEEEEKEVDEEEEAERIQLREKNEKLEKEKETNDLVDAFIGEYPDYQKYEAKIRKFANHEAYGNVPIGFIADGIAGGDAFKEGADAQKKAEKKAKETESGGSTHRRSPGKLDVWKMSKASFQELQKRVREKGRE